MDYPVDRLPNVAAMDLAAECTAYIQRDSRTAAARKRSAALKIYLERYRLANPRRWEKYRKGCNDRRNQRRREARQGVSKEQLRKADDKAKRILTAPVFVCTYCGQVIPPGSRSVDHVTPRSKGGKHVASNLTPACKSCNSRKNSRLRYRHPLTPPIPIAGP
jgi:5-methylcytosine-specific restriction endonuclease McrA